MTNAGQNGNSVASTAESRFPHSNLRGRRSKAYPDVCLERLAAEVGLSPGYMSRVMRGLNKPSLPVAQKIARTLNITLDRLTLDLEAVQPPAKKKPGTARKAKPNTVARRHNSVTVPGAKPEPARKRA